MCRIQLVVSYLALVLLALQACTATLSPVDDVNMCVGQPQTFLCSVINQGPEARLEWRVEFKDSRSVPDVIQTLTMPTSEEDQHLIRDHRDGVSFEFNLTSNSSSLESTMTVMVVDDNGTNLINNATVYCGQESDQTAVIHIHRGPPSPVTNLSNELIVSQFTRDNATLVKINWSPMVFADLYTIDVLPFVISVSTFITTNTSIQLSLLYNQEYNISVVATNCAGNSTPSFMIIRIGCCLMPLIDSMVVVEESSICAIEDSHITYHCQPGMVPSETKISICMEDGTWSPNPSDLMCTSIERNNSSHLPSSDKFISDTGVLIPVLTVSLLVFSVITFFAGCVLGILCIKCFSKTSLAKKNKNNSSSATTTSTTPFYEEVLPEITTQVNRDPETFVQNRAYEPIQINNH